jgi:ferredoxin
VDAEQVKEFARERGADLVGIGSMDRFEGAPKQMDPRYIFPEATVIIGLAFRLPRGFFRGIEEGTYFGLYPSMGYASINHMHAPTTLRALSSFIEDEGYEAVAYPNMYTAPAIYIRSRPVSPDRPAPDVLLNFRIAAFICGLGEIGYSKMFLTPRFGPRQRFAFMLTDAPLEPDPLFEGEICDRCMLCLKDCSAEAISRTETEKVAVAGRELEWGKFDTLKCSYGYTGGVKETNPFLPEDADESEWTDEPYGGGKFIKWRGIFGNNPAIEGGRGCIRACMIHLEETGRIENIFKNPFRRRKPWRL